MQKKLKNWHQHPTKQNIIKVCALWLISLFCIISATSSFFTETIFQTKNIILVALALFSIISPIRIIQNYYKLNSQK
jgi:hypothetical protein